MLWCGRSCENGVFNIEYIVGANCIRPLLITSAAHLLCERKSPIGDTPVRLSIQQTKNGEAKADQVKQFLKIQEEENEFNNRGF